MEFWESSGQVWWWMGADSRRPKGLGGRTGQGPLCLGMLVGGEHVSSGEGQRRGVGGR